MDSIAIIHRGRETYYLNLGADDYYVTDKNHQGYFCGEGAKKLELEGLNKEEFKQNLKTLFAGETIEGKTLRKGSKTTKTYHYLEHPDTKKKIVLNKFQANQIKSGDPDLYDRFTKKKLAALGNPENPQEFLVEKKHRPTLGFDNVFSAPKDVSILWALTPHNRERSAIEAAHKQAVDAAVKYLDENTYIRTGRNGTESEKAAATFARFHHQVSRDLDPQLHDHVVQLNFGISKDGKRSGAIDGKVALGLRYAAGMVYQNELRYEMERLGYKTFDRPFSDGKGMSFGIDGVTVKQRNSFSRRWMSIQKKVTPVMSGAEIRATILASRKKKEVDIAPEQLFKEWRKRGHELGFDYKRVRFGRSPRKQQKSTDYQLIARDAAKRLLYKESIYDDRNQGQSDPNKVRYLSKAQVDAALLSSMGGKHSSTFTLQALKSFKNNLLSSVEVERTKVERQKDGTEKVVTYNRTFYTLNDKGLELAGYETGWEKTKRTIAELIRRHKELRSAVKFKQKQNQEKRFNRSITFAYATGKINRKQYLQLRHNQHLPENTFTIRTYQTFGLLSKRYADYLCNRPEYQRQKHKRILAQSIKQGAVTLSPEHPDYAIVKKIQEEQRIKEWYIKQLETARKEMAIARQKEKVRKVELSR